MMLLVIALAFGTAQADRVPLLPGFTSEGSEPGDDDYHPIPTSAGCSPAG